VATPSTEHEATVLSAIQDSKHVVCELPLGRHAAACEAARLAAKEQRSLLAAAVHPLLYSRAAHFMKSRMEEGYCGEVRRVDIRISLPQWPPQWRQDSEWLKERSQGGPVREYVTPGIMLLGDLGFRVLKVIGHANYPAAPAELCEVDATGMIELEVGSATTVTGLVEVLTGVPLPEEMRISIIGTEGTLSLVDWRRLEGRTCDGTVEELYAPPPMEEGDLADLRARPHPRCISRMVHDVCLGVHAARGDPQGEFTVSRFREATVAGKVVDGLLASTGQWIPIRY